MSESEKIMSLDEVIASLSAMEQEERVRQQLSVAIRRAPEVLRACKHEKKLRAEREATAQELEDRIAALRNEVPALEKTVQRLQKELAGWKSDLQEKEKIKAQRLSELDGQIETKEQRLAELMAKLEDVRVRASV